jgi:hypothetical protein
VTAEFSKSKPFEPAHWRIFNRPIFDATKIMRWMGLW